MKCKWKKKISKWQSFILPQDICPWYSTYHMLTSLFPDNWHKNIWIQPVTNSFWLLKSGQKWHRVINLIMPITAVTTAQDRTGKTKSGDEHLMVYLCICKSLVISWIYNLIFRTLQLITLFLFWLLFWEFRKFCSPNGPPPLAPLIFQPWKSNKISRSNKYMFLVLISFFIIIIANILLPFYCNFTIFNFIPISIEVKLLKEIICSTMGQILSSKHRPCWKGIFVCKANRQ